MIRPRALASAAVAALLMSAPQAHAYAVNPLTVVLSTSGPRTSARIVVNNARGAPVDLSVVTQVVVTDAQGQRSFSPAPEQVVAFPPQFSLDRDGQQTVSIRYVGDPAVTKGAVYAVLVEQTNVTDGMIAGASGVSLKQNFVVTTVVDPPGATAAVRIVGKPTYTKAGAAVSIVNDGPAVADLTRMIWATTANGVRTRVPEEHIAYGETRFVAPGETRVISLFAVAPEAALELTAQ